jgi:D-xylono/L-arabinono-1,4-lactonase
MTVELIANYKCVCGEGPLWHPKERKLYWSDIETGRMFRFDPATDKHEQIYEGWRVGGFTFQADGSLLLFRDKGNIVTWRDGKVRDTVVDYLPAEADGRFNDVRADPEGRVFCGTLCSKPGRLYRLDTNGKLTKLVEGLGCSNGMAFTSDLTKMYFTDSGPRKIWLFDYSRATGALTNQRQFVEGKPEDGYPDGMTIDSQGDVYSARWDGYGVVVYKPDGTEDRRIKLGTKKVSSLAFGGESMTDLYFTSAGGDKPAENGADAGGLFRIKGVAGGPKGLPEFYSRIGL